MTLHTETIGSGPRIVMAHGFTQNLKCWGPLVDDLACDHTVVLVDCPGHGQSGNDDASLWEAARLLVEVGGPAIYVGYSMGGRIALHAGLAAPTLVHGLVLIGTTAGIEAEAERAERRQRDSELADRLRGGDLAEFVDTWLESPLFAGLTQDMAFRDQRLLNRSEGLVSSLTSRGTGTQESLWDRLCELTMDVLVVAGEQDPKFTAIGQRIVSEAVNANVAMLTPNGTHAIHLEQPALVADAIRNFVENSQPGGAEIGN